MIIKKSMLQKYMYLMFWIFYGTVLLAPFEDIIDDNTFRSRSSDDREKYLNKYEKELDNLRRVSDEINIKKLGRSDELPDPFADSNSRLQMKVNRVDDEQTRRIQKLQARLKELKIIHDQKELQLFVDSDRFQPIEQQLKSRLNIDDDLIFIFYICSTHYVLLERHYEQIAQPFQWRFTRRNLNDWLEKLAQQDRQQSALAA